MRSQMTGCRDRETKGMVDKGESILQLTANDFFGAVREYPTFRTTVTFAPPQSAMPVL